MAAVGLTLTAALEAPAEPVIAVSAEGMTALGPADLLRTGVGLDAVESSDAAVGQTKLGDGEVLYRPAPVQVEDQMNLRWTDHGETFEVTARLVVRPDTVPVTGWWGGDGIESGWFEATTSTFTLCADGGLDRCRRHPMPVGGPGWSPFVARLDVGARSTIGVHDPATGRLFLYRRGAMSSLLGPAGAHAIAADTDGEGVDEIGFFDGPTGLVHWADGGVTETPGSGPSALAVVGDWNDDGRESVGVYDRQTGRLTVAENGSVASGALGAGRWPIRWGHSGDAKRGDVVGFYDADAGLLRFVAGPSLLFLKDSGCGPDGLCWVQDPEEQYNPPPTDPRDNVDCLGGSCIPGQG
ncbi:MAG: hypothetical protein AAGM22_18000 [Acidobacteriota bacterium]